MVRERPKAPKPVSAPVSKRVVDIEWFLKWVYEELEKLKTSSHSGIWWKIEEYHQTGGIDPGHSSAQRYPHFGMPHPDAEIAVKIIEAVPEVEIDWETETAAIIGEYGALLKVNGPAKPIGPIANYGREMQNWNDRGAPRDVIWVRSLTTGPLVMRHAIRGTRPDWREAEPEPSGIAAPNGKHLRIIGECRGKNLYTEGSYCPLRWIPSPLSILETRVDYLIWWRGLRLLSAMLNRVCSAHTTTGPEATEMPWHAPERVRPIHPSGGTTKLTTLPLKPSRDTAGPIPRRRLGSAVRRDNV